VLLVVEVDGAAFHDGLLDRRRDEERSNRLEGLGWTVLRFRWNDIVLNPGSVVTRVRAHINSFRGASALP
jgi:very-short-patch-repair endonuclease